MATGRAAGQAHARGPGQATPRAASCVEGGEPRHADGETEADPRSALVQGRDHLRDARPLVLRLERRRHRRLPRAHPEARLPAGPRRHLPVAAALLPVARSGTTATTSPTTAAIHPRLRDLDDFRRARGGGPRARHPGAHRAGRQPHLRPAPVVPARAPRAAGLARARATTSGATPTSATRTRASSSPTPRSRTGPGIPRRKQYYWHRFFSHQPDLNFDNPAVLEEMLDVHALLARPRRRRLPARRDPLPRRARRHELREPARDPRHHASSSAPRRRALSRAGCCSPRPTSGPPTCAPTSARATSATWRSTSRSCRASSWRSAWRTSSPSSTSWRRRRHPRHAASGRSSCATTTS